MGDPMAKRTNLSPRNPGTPEFQFFRELRHTFSDDDEFEKDRMTEGPVLPEQTLGLWVGEQGQKLIRCGNHFAQANVIAPHR